MPTGLCVSNSAPVPTLTNTNDGQLYAGPGSRPPAKAWAWPWRWAEPRGLGSVYKLQRFALLLTRPRRRCMLLTEKTSCVRFSTSKVLWFNYTEIRCSVLSNSILGRPTFAFLSNKLPVGRSVNNCRQTGK